MPEVAAAITAAVATHTDADEAGVLSLLEGPSIHANGEPAANLTLTTESSAGGLLREEDIAAMVVPHDPTSHQARAVAALQQADTVSEHHQLGVSSIGGISQQRIQDESEKQQFSLGNSTQPVDLSPQHLSQSKDELDMTAVSMADPKSACDRPIAAMASDFGLTTASPHSICLCQAPTRIPRPRNAFILFRQHHHAAVVAQYPGKPNPEISKIIGQMWKRSGDEVKAVWQSHADEEKRQHLQRYPQYRYQPRRSGKKNAAAAAAAAAATSPAPTLETAICPNCGGRTGALPTPQTPASSISSRKTVRNSTSTASTRKVGSPDDTASRESVGSGSGVGVEQAGIEALLQLGLRNEEDDMMGASLQSPPKRRKLNTSISPTSTSLPGPPLLQQSLYSTQYGHGSDPNIDPYLRQGSFDHESPTPALEHDSIDSGYPISHFGTQSSGDFSIRAIPILKKVYAISKICPPISSLPLPPFGTPAVTRMPIISVDGDEVGIVTDLYRALSIEIEKTESVYLIDELDDLTGLSEAYLEGLLNSTGLEKDKETDDADAARYLSHVAFWRRKSSEMRRIVGTSQSNTQTSNTFDSPQPQLVLINRYILSRSDAAALRLSTDGLSPLEHWQWCATVWRSCVGPDMTIYVQTLDNGIVGDDDVEWSGGKEWGEKVIRRLGFEIGEIVRSLKGFPG
ncbi:hypothetical protein BDD12DRAFT_987178 [Trichophaea hybrida]|nr:hypothetical protein BDD12DRAFT_987178 [Trichophaea hybrida]